MYDTALAAWLVALIDHVEADAALGPLFAELVRAARRSAALGGDTVFDPEDHLGAATADAFADLARTVSATVRLSGAIDWPSLAERPILGDMKPSIRLGALPHLEDVASVGDVYVGIADDTLPNPPPETWWAIGFPRGRTTIGMLPKAPPG